MKEFIYYNFLLEKFKEKFNQFEKIYNVLRAREETGLEDNTLSHFIDYLANDMADLCCNRYNSIEREGFGNILYDFIDKKEIYCYNSKNNKDITYILSDIEDLFDFCYAFYLKSNLIQSSKRYTCFGSETKDAYLFLCYDNDYIDEFYTDEQLTAIANEITEYYSTILDIDGTLYCWYDGDSFSLEDHQYVSIEKYKQMRNHIDSLS